MCTTLFQNTQLCGHIGTGRFQAVMPYNGTMWMVVDNQVFNVPLSNIDSPNGRWNLKDDNSAQAVYMGSWRKLFKELKVTGNKSAIPKGAQLVRVFF